MSLLDGVSNFLFGTDEAMDAAREAGDIQAGAIREGIGETRRQFNITQETLAPAIEAGDQAREQQMILLGLRGEDAQQQLLSRLQESPAQKFIRKRAERTLIQNASATGGLGGGNLREQLVELGAGFASKDIDKQFDRLGQIVAPGTQTAVNQSQFGTQVARDITQGTASAGAAEASGILGAQQARAQGMQNLMSTGTTAAILA